MTVKVFGLSLVFYINSHSKRVFNNLSIIKKLIVILFLSFNDDILQ